ncbi:hypothetical protein N6H18_02845 [Reichenbachiella agarivorans]|uniref:N-acetyltransferase domain-containing protein n=1 Tax=Reichenbachiella agarivorans TaxID=2979464 RepID=A0ABY6CU41_9BACT|nr:hypothetical protein [Reichenbachiella agarivorans]UXP32893.1 hypothetical protein N6H18_02845 [Reichenbachiella agarivorans]
MISIKQVSNKKDLKKFIDFPHELYANDEHYVPELYMAQADMLNKSTFPFFQHSEAEFFLAYQDDKIVGRIAAIKNNNYIEYTNKQVGQFGFFDTIDDYEVAKALLDTVKNWIAQHGLNQITGPYNYSTNETCGTLIEGFDSPPTLMMTYNKPYYADFMDRYGFEKDMDLLSYIVYTKDVPEKLTRMSNLLFERLNSKGITIRKANLSKFKEEVDKLYQIYNSAWEKNWGFVPMTEAEFKHSAKDMKMIVDPDFLLIAEAEGKPIAFSLSLPDLNMPLKHLKRGRLLPFGLFKLLYYKRKINRVRVITLGIVEQYRKLGIDAYFYAKAFEEAKNKKMLFGEASWILENNEMMNRAITNINGKVYKKHRLYKKAI